MNTPKVGKTISEAFGAALSRYTKAFVPLLMPLLLFAAFIAVVVVSMALSGGFTESSSQTISLQEILTGIDDSAKFEDRLFSDGFTVIAQFLYSVLSIGILAVVAGALRRSRTTGEMELPSFFGMVPATIQQIRLLAPRVYVIPALTIAGTVTTIFMPVLGTLVSLVTFIAGIYLTIRWLYAPIISGAGEGQGTEVYQRSEAAVDGNWWPTFGVFIVVGLALAVAVIPLFVAGLVATMLLMFVGLSVSLGVGLGLVVPTILGILSYPFITLYLAAAYESAWNQVSPIDGGSADAIDPVTPASSGAM